MINDQSFDGKAWSLTRKDWYKNSLHTILFSYTMSRLDSHATQGPPLPSAHTFNTRVVVEEGNFINQSMPTNKTKSTLPLATSLEQRRIEKKQTKRRVDEQHHR